MGKMEGSRSNKLKTKDLIVAGAFAALYVVLLLVMVTLTGFVPVLYILSPLILGIVLGTVYMLYVSKIQKRWAVMILAVMVGLITSLGGLWYYFVWAFLIGVIADIVVNLGARSQKKYILSYMVFALTNVGPLWAFVFTKDALFEGFTKYYGQAYADAIDNLLPPWIVFAFFGMAVVGGLVGGLLGRKLTKKHFEKAGVV